MPTTKKRKQKAEKKDAEEFKIDTSDTRFAPLFKSPDFAPDPTHPQ